ncbi:hypothetical protein [Actinacidiphila cocklensis]|uniref:hypothetical protein n=1 Tax=Actinacidiphila cocklensis TaxID=887465 RepID=UPI00203AD1BB|nr:hypothetical protein [Actinacidiphila cocklensis]
MGRFTQWQVVARPPLSSNILDRKNLHGSRGDAIMAAVRLVFGTQEPTLQRDRAAAWSVTWNLMQRGRASYRGTTYSVTAIDPIYFKEMEETDE